MTINTFGTLCAAGAALILAQAAVSAGSAATHAPGAPLPAGYLIVRGNQIVDSRGNPVRLACVGGWGTDVVGGRIGYDHTPAELNATMAQVRSVGFNCIRVDFTDKSVSDPTLMGEFDQLVAACARNDIKVIFDNHNDEATPANWGNAAQQFNGLWFDKGPGTDGTDGAGDKGTVTRGQFLRDWQAFARHWAGNTTVIGFDLRNEPCAHTSTPALWGGGGPTDIHAMYETVGDAVQAIDPGALIICESVINYKTDSYEGDLSPAKTLPIVLKRPHKLVYSVHEYPREIGGYKGAQSGPDYIARMNRCWGWLVKDNIAPVWIGEMGSSMVTANQKAWGDTLLSYMDGTAPGGPRFTGREQPVSGDWWCWGYLPGEHPDGCLGQDNSVRPDQAPYLAQLMYAP